MDSHKKPEPKRAGRPSAALITTGIFLLLLFLAAGIFMMLRVHPSASPEGADALSRSQQASQKEDRSLYARLGIDIVLQCLYQDQPQEKESPPDATVSGQTVPAPATPTDTAAPTEGSSQKKASPSSGQAVPGQAVPATPTDTAASAAASSQKKAAAASDSAAASTQKEEASGGSSETSDSEKASASEKASDTKKSSDSEIASASEKTSDTKKASASEIASASEKTSDTEKTSEPKIASASEKNAEAESSFKRRKNADTEDSSGSKTGSESEESSDPKDSLTKNQKKHVQAWEKNRGYSFPLNAPLNDYDWKYLDRTDDGRLSYEGDDRYEILHGIDVSEFQGKIDWEKVKSAGFDFAFIRAGYRTFDSGTLTRDERAVKNLRRANNAGLDVGLYFFSQAVTKEEAREEAQLCLDILEESGVELTLPIVYDPEIQPEYAYARINYISREQFTDNAIAFCRKIKKAGYIPAIYANSSTQTDLLDLSRLSDVVIWNADYNIPPESPYLFTFWQYSETGQVDGVTEPATDLNVWFVEK